MRTIVHLSDLHFGRTDPLIPPVLAEAAREAKPDLVVVSGDFTQRARGREFEAAAAFLAELPKPVLTVPGNHDVPLYDLTRRWLSPLDRYRRYISHDLSPVHEDAEMMVAGINTARALTFKNGRVNVAQIAATEALLSRQGPEVIRVVVTHHPFDTGEPDDTVVGRAGLAMERFLAAGVDMILSGHMHVSRVDESVKRYPSPRGAVLLVQAGTATSTRGRGETNAFNVIHLAWPEAWITPMLWNPASMRFEPAATTHHVRRETGWSRGETA